MVFEIIYLTKAKGKDKGSQHKQSCFLEKNTPPERPEIVELVKRTSHGDFEEASIEVQICSAFEAQVLRNLEIPIYPAKAAAYRSQPHA